jgi:hypothetical protein
MATKEELFVSISPEVYRRGKSSVLMSQADLLTTLKRLQNLRVLDRQKQDLKMQLHKLFLSLSSNLDSLQEKMPTAEVPKTIHIGTEKKEVPEKDFSKRDSIEEELKAIREKLRQINSN